MEEDFSVQPTSVRRHVALQALGDHDFRWFWGSQLAHFATGEMGSVARGWLAYELTGSALAIAWVTAGSSIARFVLSLYAGALADRFEKRHLLIVTQAATTVNALIITVLAVTGAVQVWHLATSSLVEGIISSFGLPAQKVYLSELVGAKALLNAISLTSLARGIVGIFGAALAGFAIEWLGVGSVYLVITAAHLVALLALGQLRLLGAGESDGASVWADLRESLGYLRVEPAIVPLLGIALVRALLGFSHRALMPVYVKDVLQLGPSALGILSAAPSFGALVGSFVLASKGDLRGKGRVLIGAGLAMAVSLIAFANIRNLALVLVSLVVIGAARVVTRAANQALIQINCARALRGRVMALYMMTMGLQPLGVVSAGAVADAAGVSLAITLQGGLMLAIFLTLLLSRSRVKRLA